MIEITTPVGRLVRGHPMTGYAVKDDKTGQPKMQRDGVTPRTDYYIAIAIPKGTETHWNQTAWGGQIYQQGVTDWPNGQYNMPTFAWKITDGDSQIPNKKGNKPCDREGYPGHWIINATQGFPIRCYHRGRYDPEQQIQRNAEIKTGDYVRIVINVKGNGRDNESPGMYINPSMLELYQGGVEIISTNAPDPKATFGAVEGTLPAGALIDTNVQAMPPAQVAQVAPAVPAVTVAQVAPAVPTAQVAPPAQVILPAQVAQVAPPAQAMPLMTTKAQGVPYEAWVAQGWTDDQLIAEGYMMMMPTGVTPSTTVLG